MIKLCGVVLMLLGSFAYTQTSDLWFTQGGLIGVFFFFSEALFEFVTTENKSRALLDITEIQNV
jgi:hypothetical protein